MKKNKESARSSKKVYILAYGAMIAAIYVALTVPFQPIAFGPIQFRISEVLCVLPFFTPAAIPGLFIGCLLSNFLCGAVIYDVIFGSIATLIGAIGSWYLRKWKYSVSIPPIISNILIVPWVLRYAYGAPDAIWYMMITVGIGEILAIGVLGNGLLYLLSKDKAVTKFLQRKF